jgi:hypothetical protein
MTNNKDSAVLKPCPFCGGQAEIVEFETAGGPWWMGKCQEPSCGAVGPAFTTKAEAIAVYNTRKPTQGYGVVTAANYTSPIGGAGAGLQTVVSREGMAACTDRIGGDCVVTHGVVVDAQSDALRDQLLQECLVKLRDVQGTEAPKQYACNLIKRIERVLQGQTND